MKDPLSPLVFVSYGALGDFLMLLSLSDALHESNPRVRILVVTTRSAALFRELAAAYPWVEVLPLSKRNPIGAFARLLPLAFRKTGVLLLPTFGTIPKEIILLGRLLTLRPGGAFVGFAGKQEAAFTETVPFDTDQPIYANIVRAAPALGYPLPVHGPTYRFAEVPGLLERLGLARPYIVMHPFAANKKRSLPLRRWKALIAEILAAHPGHVVALTGGPADAADAAELSAATGARNLAGALRMAELATLLRDAALFVGVDTGVTHLASMLRAPSVVVGNRSNPTWLPYYNERARILFETARCTCRGDKSGRCEIEENGQVYYRCVYDLTDQKILGAIAEVLEGGR